MSFEKFMDLIENNRLYFCRADRFEDALEGYYTKLVYDIAKGISIEAHGKVSNEGVYEKTAKIREGSYISCWNLSESESVALWKMYGGKNSVAIETTVGDLTEQTRDKGEVAVVPLFQYEICLVDYIDHRSIDAKLAKKILVDPISPLRHKNIAFEFEKEVRVIYQSVFLHVSEIPEKFGAGFYIPVKRERLAQKVLVSPYADNWFFELVSRTLDRFERCARPEWSKLKYTPFHEAYFGSSERS